MATIPEQIPVFIAPKLRLNTGNFSINLHGPQIMTRTVWYESPWQSGTSRRGKVVRVGLVL